jgi:predicted Zn-dependent peptidase
MEHYDRFTLSNGIRVIHHPMNREVGHCGLLIGAGSRDELAEEHGLAHFMEHCLFKGTKRRKTFHILTRLDAVGGELNAFTAKEETWIHASFLKAHYERAIELIADISFQASFPEKEIEKEKDVILDELNSYRDSPSDMIFEEFDALFYGTHRLGRSILGSEQCLGKFNRQSLIEFRRRVFQKDNMVFASCGPIDRKNLELMLEAHIGCHNIPGGKLRRTPFKHYRPKSLVREKDIHQVHYLMGFPAFDYPDKRRPALSLLNNIIGGPGLNNRLSLHIREKYGFAYHVDSTYAPFTDSGIFSIYLGTDQTYLQKCEHLIWKELNSFKAKNLSDRQLKEAKIQLCGQIALAQDSGSALMFNLGKSVLLFDRIDSLKEVYAQIHSISAKQVREVANEVFDRKKMTELTYAGTSEK